MSEQAPRPSFDLLSEPWIPCVAADGTSVELGLRDAILRAHELRAIADPSPLATFALHRLALALIHRVMRGPTTVAEWRAIWVKGRFDEQRFNDYFTRWQARFDLYHPTWPFYQTAGFTIVDSKGKPASGSPVSRLVPELATGNNATLFDHTLEASNAAMSAAQAARATVVAQTWGLGGGKGPRSNLFNEHPYLSHAPCVGAVAVLLGGTDLFQTLALNLVRIGPKAPSPSTSGEGDLPAWEQDASKRQPIATAPLGYVDTLTWPARHVRLEPTPDGLVATMHIAQGPLMDAELRGDNPFAFYRSSEKFGRNPVALSATRAVWRDSSALLAIPAENEADCRPLVLQLSRERQVAALVGPDRFLNLACYGLANDKAKPLAWRREEIPASVRLIEDPDLTLEVEAAMGAVENVGSALRSACRKLAYELLATPDKSPDTAEVTRLQTRLFARTGYWEGIAPGFEVFMRGLTGDLAQAADSRRAWIRAAMVTARSGLARAAGFAEGSIARTARAVALANQSLAYELRKVPGLVEPSPPSPQQPESENTL